MPVRRLLLVGLPVALLLPYTTSQAVATQIIALFKDDERNFEVARLNSAVLLDAARLTEQYGNQGLRSLDAIQLACALQVRTQADLFLTADQRLAAVFQQEGLLTQ